MKKNELMVGDIVFDLENNSIVTISEVRDFPNYAPLMLRSKKMLRRWGFKQYCKETDGKEEWFYVYCIQGKEERNNVTFFSGRDLATNVAVRLKGKVIFTCKVENVHELQHVFNFCGIPSPISLEKL